jgi:glutamine amidotransferase
MHVLIVDMGMGNIRSLVSALNFLGVGNTVSDQLESFGEATHIILPGVGAFDAAMAKLTE